MEATDLIDLGLDMVTRAPHLYLVSVAYWVLVASVLLTRYGLRRIDTSDRLMRAVLVLGGVALTLAFVDAAARGQELIQISLVAYFATPIGIGRALIRRWDHQPSTRWASLGLRQLTYLTAFVAFVALSVVDGDPWWFTRPEIDRSSAVTIIENTNWFHLMASVFGLMAVAEAVTAMGGSTRAAEDQRHHSASAR